MRGVTEPPVIVVGGSYGTHGRARFDDGSLVVDGATTARYGPDQVTAISATKRNPGRSGCLGATLGGALLVVFGYLGLGLPGIGLALFLAVSIGYYTHRELLVDVTFDDGRRVRLVCVPGGLERLRAFRRGAG